MAAEDHDEKRPRLSTSPAGVPGGSSVPASEERSSANTPAAGGGLRRLPAFFRASWAELRRVRWPDRTQVAQGTGVVIVFVLLAGAFLGGVDTLASKLVELVI